MASSSTVLSPSTYSVMPIEYPVLLHFVNLVLPYPFFLYNYTNNNSTLPDEAPLLMSKSSPKELILIRHAKSSWADPSLDDRDRPLNKRGKRDAPFMGKRLASHSCIPDKIISSPAKRTRKTARTIARQLSYPKKDIILLEDLYTSSVNTMYRVVRACDEDVNRLFLVGHNYVITDFCVDLTGAAIDNIPTCGIAGIRFTGPWSHIASDSGELLFFDYPKLHTSK